MEHQITDTILMIRPVAFQCNTETALNNYFQHASEDTDTHIQAKAVAEFDHMVEVLQTQGINVLVIEDTVRPKTPDSIFPNNWVSFHQDGQVMLYPMYAKNRREERREDILDFLKKDFKITQVDTLAPWEQQGYCLEGTGSLILDRQNQLAYASLSERTTRRVIADFEERTGYRTIAFHAHQTVGKERLPIYHTNVMMAVGEAFAVVCLDTIDNQNERKMVVDELAKNNKEIIAISEAQMHQFAGNMLQVRNRAGNRFVAMSEAAFLSLSQEQREKLGNHGALLHSPIPTIEMLGGGSVRCMMAEVFLPRLD